MKFVAQSFQQLKKNLNFYGVSALKAFKNQIEVEKSTFSMKHWKVSPINYPSLIKVKIKLQYIKPNLPFNPLTKTEKI